MDALEQFKTHGYAEQLKTQITSDSIPLGHEDLLAFLYNQIINIWHVLHLQFTPIHAELFCIMSQIFLFLLHLCVPSYHMCSICCICISKFQSQYCFIFILVRYYSKQLQPTKLASTLLYCDMYVLCNEAVINCATQI